MICKCMYMMYKYMYVFTIFILCLTGKASEEISALVSDNGLWRELCFCHFSHNQLQNYIQNHNKLRQHKDINWYRAYTKLYR